MIDTVRSYGVYEQESAATTPLRTQNESGSPATRYTRRRRRSRK
jgi:hypothetical protein